MKRKEKLRELNELSGEQLKERLKDLSIALLKNRFEAKTGHVDNPCLVREIRKDIARVKTIESARAGRAK